MSDSKIISIPNGEFLCDIETPSGMELVSVMTNDNMVDMLYLTKDCVSSYAHAKWACQGLAKLKYLCVHKECDNTSSRAWVVYFGGSNKDQIIIKGVNEISFLYPELSELTGKVNTLMTVEYAYQLYNIGMQCGYDVLKFAIDATKQECYEIAEEN